MRSAGQRAVMALIVAMSLVSAGCASFKQNNLPEISGFPAVPAETKPSATYSFAYTYKMFGEGQGPESSRITMSQEFFTILTESTQFSSVKEAASGGDVHIDAQIHNFGNPAAVIPAFITGFSLFTIPSWATDRWRLTANVSTQNGGPRSYVLEDAEVMVQWLPMIFLTPFKSPFHVIPEVRKNMYKNLIKNMRDGGDLGVAQSRLISSDSDPVP